MNDQDIEALLRRYRPVTQLPEYPITGSSRTWPWAVAAAALLAITVGLHGAAVPALDAPSSVDEQRVQAIIDDLGGPQNRRLAEWIARQEARADREARLARAASEGDGWNRR